MKKFVIIAFVFALSCSPVRAEEPLTFEQAQAMALQKVNGTVSDTGRSTHNGAVVYEFEIAQEDGTVMKIEIDSLTREILELKVSNLGPDAKLPEPALKKEEAQAIAVRHVEDNFSGLRAVEVTGGEYKVEEGAFVYKFALKRGIRTYDVAVDANTGKVIAARQAE